MVVAIARIGCRSNWCVSQHPDTKHFTAAAQTVEKDSLTRRRMWLYPGMVTGMLYIVLMFFGKQGMVMGGGEADSEFETLNATDQKESRSYEQTWAIVAQPRCCSDCTYVAAGFKCKLKSCLTNCPWARSTAAPRARPVF